MAKKKRVLPDAPMATGKTPASAFSATEKRPFASAPSRSESEKTIAWRLSIADFEGTWSWGAVRSSKAREILSKLKEFEKFSWAQLAKDRHHKVHVSQLAPSAHKRLGDLKQDDIDDLYSLRLSGRERVWGVLHGNVFYLLWWDPEHSVCPSIKKHT